MKTDTISRFIITAIIKYQDQKLNHTASHRSRAHKKQARWSSPTKAKVKEKWKKENTNRRRLQQLGVFNIKVQAMKLRGKSFIFLRAQTGVRAQFCFHLQLIHCNNYGIISTVENVFFLSVLHTCTMSSEWFINKPRSWARLSCSLHDIGNKTSKILFHSISFFPQQDRLDGFFLCHFSAALRKVRRNSDWLYKQEEMEIRSLNCYLMIECWTSLVRAVRCIKVI